MDWSDQEDANVPYDLQKAVLKAFNPQPEVVEEWRAARRLSHAHRSQAVATVGPLSLAPTAPS